MIGPNEGFVWAWRPSDEQREGQCGEPWPLSYSDWFTYTRSLPKKRLAPRTTAGSSRPLLRTLPRAIISDHLAISPTRVGQNSTGPDLLTPPDKAMYRRRHDDAAYDAEADEAPRPRKQRKQRPCFSCAGKSTVQWDRGAPGGGRVLGEDDVSKLISHARPECRRLKMKCNRQGKGRIIRCKKSSNGWNCVAVPCSNCVRRNRVEFCTAARSGTEHSRFVL